MHRPHVSDYEPVLGVANQSYQVPARLSGAASRCIEDAHCQAFFAQHNTMHRHLGIRHTTLHSAHYDHADVMLITCNAILDAALLADTQAAQEPDPATACDSHPCLDQPATTVLFGTATLTTHLSNGRSRFVRIGKQ